MSTVALIIAIHQVVFQGMFFAKNIALHRRLGVPIRGRNREAVLAVAFIAVYIIGSVVLGLMDAPFGTVAVLASGAAMPVALTLLAASVLLSAASLIGMRDSWRVGVLEDQRTELIEGGIYRFSRNPYFLSYLVMFAGYAVLLQNWMLLIGWFIAFGFVHAMVLKEEQHLSALHGEAYRQYMKRTPRYFII